MPITLLGPVSYDLNGFEIELSVKPSTSISIPPLGEVKAQTHLPPLELKVTLIRIDLQKLKGISMGTLRSGELLRKLEERARAIIWNFIFRLFLFAALGGAAGALFLPKRSLISVLKGILIGLCLALLLVGTTYGTFDADALRQRPRVIGALVAAPWIVGRVEEKLSAIEIFRKEIRLIATNLHKFYSRVEAWGPVELDKETIRVLHISDIHNNPAAVDLVERVAGNYDSPQVIAELKRIENIGVLEGEPVTIGGIKLLGFADPASNSVRMTPASNGAMKKIARELVREIKSMQKPLILAVHDRRMAEEAMGAVPIILCGHTHVPSVKKIKGTVLINAGTTGAAGLRTFRVEEDIPYSLYLLHIQLKPPRLIALDFLEISGVKRGVFPGANLNKSARS
ncbi:MAG: metallophosphoesterase family protein [Actinomycetota bacterium]|nr:metallophosphoesterase family protein [Actinomycetota bacterium]